ncbi:MAG: Magnesium transporter MgtE [Phycisphaerae bacterium]|nr:Magnesium transporter MgtE [Phycisphaerae bacterium]
MEQLVMNRAVGEQMRREFTALSASQTVAQALTALRAGQLQERIVYFYIVDDDRKLRGVVPTRRLLMAKPETPLTELMVTNVICIPQSMPLAQAGQFFLKHRYLALPVVDKEQRLVGVVDVSMFTDQFSDLINWQESQDIFQLIGVQLDQADRRSIRQGYFSRFPWLLCNIAGGLICALLTARYELFLDHFLVLAFFIPMVLTLAESVSMQSMSLTLRNLHGTRVDWGCLWQALRRELIIALLLGVSCGGLVGTIAWGWKGQPLVAGSIAVSIVMAIVTACLLGVLLPMVMRALQADPRIASGPVVLATADALTLLFYFQLSTWLLPDAGAITPLTDT